MHIVKLTGVVFGVFFVLPLAVSTASRHLLKAVAAGERLARSSHEITLTCLAITGIALLAGSVAPLYAFIVGVTCVLVLLAALVGVLVRRDRQASEPLCGAALSVPRSYPDAPRLTTEGFSQYALHQPAVTQPDGSPAFAITARMPPA